MIEILIMVFGVLPWFYRTAKTHRRNPVGWMVIGALSYYIPVIVMGRIILPVVLEGQVTRDNMIAMVFLSMAVSVGAGVAGCLLARQVLLSAPESQAMLNVASAGQTKCDACGNDMGVSSYLEHVEGRGYLCHECRHRLR